MADRAAEDRTTPATEEISAAPTVAELRELREMIGRRLETHYRDARLPQADHLGLVAWEAAHAKEWTATWKPQRLGRARAQYVRRFPNAARKPVMVWPPPKSAIEWIPADASPKWLAERKEWRAAVESAPRLFARPPRFAKQGPLPKRWALVLGAFAPRLASVLVQAGAPVSTRSSSPFTKTCRDILRSLLQNEKLPAISTVSDALRKIIVVKRNTSDK